MVPVAPQMDFPQLHQGPEMCSNVNILGHVGVYLVVQATLAGAFFTYTCRYQQTMTELQRCLGKTSVEEIVTKLSTQGGIVQKITRESYVIRFSIPLKAMTINIVGSDSDVYADVFLPDSQERLTPGLSNRPKVSKGTIVKNSIFASLLYGAPLLISGLFVTCTRPKLTITQYLKHALVFDAVAVVIILIAVRRLGII